ncbi:MAG: carbohydrate binding domain-containing protein [Candidatus Omnitrophota bacterium]|jgi:hypothetical protein
MFRPILVICLAAAIFSPFESACAVMIGRNLLVNESFENRPGFKDQDPRDWGTWNNSFNGLSTTERRKGQQSVYFLCPKQGDSTGVFYTYKKAKPGNKYIFRCYVMNSREDPVKGDAFGQLSIEWRKTTKDKDNKDVQVEISRDFGQKFGPGLPRLKWTLVTVSGIAPQDTDNCNFVIQFFNNASGGGKFFADDVSAEEIDKDTALKDYALGKTGPKNTPSAASAVTRAGPAASASNGGSAGAIQLLVADYDSGSKPNNLGGDMGCWNKDPNDKTQGCNMGFNGQGNGRGGSGQALQLDYDVDSPNEALDGYWMTMGKQDLSSYKNLSLWIKGDSSIGFSKSIKIELKNSGKEQSTYVLSGITGEWKRFAVPLADFKDIKDLTSMTEFVIRFDDKVNADKKQGRIYVDDIGFTD